MKWAFIRSNTHSTHLHSVIHSLIHSLTHAHIASLPIGNVSITGGGDGNDDGDGDWVVPPKQTHPNQLQPQNAFAWTTAAAKQEVSLSTLYREDSDSVPDSEFEFVNL